MGSLISIEAQAENSDFARLIISSPQMNQLYEEILNSSSESGAAPQTEIRVEQFLTFMKKKYANSKKKKDRIFNQVAADPRIMYEGYRYIVKMRIEEEGSDNESDALEEDVGFGDSEKKKEEKVLLQSASAPSFNKKGSLLNAKSQTSTRMLNTEKYNDMDMYITKKEFTIFLPTVRLFSILWEVFVEADSNLKNCLVSRTEYESAYKILSKLQGVSVREALTKERWVKEFDVIDSNGNGVITFQELCDFAAEKIVMPSEYKKSVADSYVFYDMDEDSNLAGVALRAGAICEIPASKDAQSYVATEADSRSAIAGVSTIASRSATADAGADGSAASADAGADGSAAAAKASSADAAGGKDVVVEELSATLFQLGTKKKDKHCHISVARLVNKNGNRVIEFAAIINEGEDERDTSLYGRKSYCLKLPNGKIASQGDFTLSPPAHLLPSPGYLLRDKTDHSLISRGVEVTLTPSGPSAAALEAAAAATAAAAADTKSPKNASGQKNMKTMKSTKSMKSLKNAVRKMTISVEDGIFRIPYDEVPNACYSVHIDTLNYFAPQDFEIVKFNDCFTGNDKAFELQPKFHRCNLQEITAWEKAIITAPAEELHAVSSDLESLPRALQSIVRYGDGPLRGKRDPYCTAKAVAVLDKQSGDVVVEFEPQLADGVDPLDVSLQGNKTFVLAENSGHRVAQGSFRLLPQRSLQPRATYILKDSTTDLPVSETGTALITAKKDPRTLDELDILPSAGVKVPIVNGVLVPPLHDLPDGVLTITVKQINGYMDGGEVTFVKFEQNVVRDETQPLYVDPLPPPVDLGSIMTGVTVDIAASSYAERVLRSRALPQKLNVEVQQRSNPGFPDLHCVAEVTAVSQNGIPIIQFQPKIIADVNQLDYSLYGWKKFSVANLNGQLVVEGTFKLVPQASCLPRIKYNLRDCTTNLPITSEEGKASMIISAKKDHRTLAGEHVMDDVEVPIIDSTIILPLDDIPDALITITPKVEGFIATDFTVLKFGGHVDRGEQALFLNPVMDTPGQCRVTLQWGAAPRDLDIHVKTSQGEEVSYSTRNTKNSSVKLDVDIMTGFGPETITFKPDKDVKYRIFVHNFSKCIELYKSEAVIFFSTYDQTHNFELRISQDSHKSDFIYWDCFEMTAAGIPTITNFVSDRSPDFGEKEPDAGDAAATEEEKKE